MQRLFVKSNVFVTENFLKQAGQVFNADTLQIETLTAGKDGYRNLADFGGGKDEFDMGRRLFQSLQQCVESAFGKHVNFVDDVDFITGIGRFVADAVKNFADIVDTGMRSRIKFHNINMPSFGYRPAVFADAAGMNRRAAFAVKSGTVQSFGDNTGRGRFADAADAGKYIGMMQTVVLNRIGKRLYQRILTDQIVKVLRTILAGKDNILVIAAVFGACIFFGHCNLLKMRRRAGDLNRFRYGCFLPDLTGLAEN